jgi:hypothetical protein
MLVGWFHGHLQIGFFPYRMRVVLVKGGERSFTGTSSFFGTLFVQFGMAHGE